MPELDPALTVPCPTCGQPPGLPCISRHAVSVHGARRRRLANLEKEADRILKEGKET